MNSFIEIKTTGVSKLGDGGSLKYCEIIFEVLNGSKFLVEGDSLFGFEV